MNSRLHSLYELSLEHLYPHAKPTACKVIARMARLVMPFREAYIDRSAPEWTPSSNTRDSYADEIEQIHASRYIIRNPITTSPTPVPGRESRPLTDLLMMTESRITEGLRDARAAGMVHSIVPILHNGAEARYTTEKIINPVQQYLTLAVAKDAVRGALTTVDLDALPPVHLAGEPLSANRYKDLGFTSAKVIDADVTATDIEHAVRLLDAQVRLAHTGAHRGRIYGNWEPNGFDAAPALLDAYGAWTGQVLTMPTVPVVRFDKDLIARGQDDVMALLPAPLREMVARPSKMVARVAAHPAPSRTPAAVSVPAPVAATAPVFTDAPALASVSALPIAPIGSYKAWDDARRQAATEVAA